MAQAGLSAFEPAFVDELAEILRWSFDHLQDENGGSVYLRLSTRILEQPERVVDEAWTESLIEGAYWQGEPGPGAALAGGYNRAVAPEAPAAFQGHLQDVP